MKKIYILLFSIVSSILAYADNGANTPKADTNEVKSLNKSGFDMRFTNSNETINYAKKALTLAQKLGYTNGIAEAYRVKGVGEYYQNKSDSAINDYLNALAVFETAKNLAGQAKVYNNIGNLYQEVDYQKALDYFRKAQVIGEKNHDQQLIASLNLNIGNVYFRKNSFNQALVYYNLAYDGFKKLNDQKFLVQCLQDLGAIYFNLNQTAKAEELLQQANQNAKLQDMNAAVASINIELTELYLKEDKLDQAEKYLKEGIAFAQLVNNNKFLSDYRFQNYELELKRKNYKQALDYMREIYKQDSTTLSSINVTKFNLAREEQQHRVEADFARKDQENATQRFWFLAVVSGLLLVLTGLLTTNVKRKASTNAKLQELNNEISRQKDNLDRINHHLEEIIDERTRDLQAKNKKLSDYSSYLSHQIRGPIATLKGLMNLEREGLVDQNECISMMNKCVSEIDEKIIEMSDMLHDQGK
jgi:tetratricopeptide (TPR) repeat protein